MKASPTDAREERPAPGTSQPAGSPRAPAPPKRKRFHWGWIVLIVVVAGVGYTYWYNHRPEPGFAGSGAHHRGFRRFAFGAGFGAMPVIAAPAERSAMDIYLNGLGTVTPIASVTVQSQISGELVKVAFTEGQEVKKGDLLAVIDPRPYQVAEEQAKGQLLQAQAQLEQAKADLARYVALAKEDSIAQQQVDDEQALVDQDQGLVVAAQAAIDTAKLNLTYCHIVAPFSGRVGLRQVDPGNYVTPSEPNGIVVLTQLKPMSVIFTLPEDDVDQVAARLRSGGPIPVYAYDRTMTTKLASGTLATIDNEIDTTTGTVRLRALFPNQNEALFPNEFVNARMLLEVRKDALVIPTSAIERGENGTFVYVVQPDDTVTARTVTLGPAEGERQSILSGISAGDRVVSDGADKLKEGMKVMIQAPGSTGAAPGASAGAVHAPGARHWGGRKGRGKAGGRGRPGQQGAKRAGGAD